ncbi:MAG: MFS transporter [Segniliparus sp.]|uniref:MFS transporter n=1 Tax=Segniliparus sp. TaxID=2804064 RepID=UPI003F3AD43C
MPLGLIALAIGGFGIGLTEFGIMGLLPELARDFAVSEQTAGYLISGYALAVAIGAVLVTAGVSRFDRKRVLLGLMVLFIIGNLLSAIAPTFEAMMLGRVVAALCHGAFFGVGAVVAASLVAPGRQAAAVSMMLGGLTLANVLGVPFGTFLGQHFGWRSTFWAITAIGVVGFVAIAALTPADGARDREGGSLRAEIAGLRSGEVWLSMGLTIFGWGGVFGGFSYIAFTLTRVGGFASATVPWLLILFGLGMCVGNYFGGKSADRRPTGALLVAFGGVVATLVVFALAADVKPVVLVALALLGAFGFAMCPALQTRVMRSAADAPTLASGANVAAFNVGNTLGPWLAGLAIGAGYGFVSPLWVGAGMTALALAALVADTALRQRARNGADGEQADGEQAGGRDEAQAAADDALVCEAV